MDSLFWEGEVGGAPLSTASISPLDAGAGVPGSMRVPERATTVQIFWNRSNKTHIGP